MRRTAVLVRTALKKTANNCIACARRTGSRAYPRKVLARQATGLARQGSKSLVGQRHRFQGGNCLCPLVCAISAFVGTLAHFLFPPRAATERQGVRVMFVVFTAFICPLVAQLTLCRGGGRSVVVPAGLTTLAATFGSVAGVSNGNAKSSANKAAKNCSYGTHFSLPSPCGDPAAQQQNQDVRPRGIGQVYSPGTSCPPLAASVSLSVRRGG